MNQVNFGIGYIGAIPAGGGSPISFGILKDISLDYTRTHKGIRGQYRYDIDRAIHQEKLTGKASFAQINGSLYAAAFGATSTTGLVAPSIAEPHVIPTTPFTVTVTNSATFDMDLGVVNLASGVIMTEVASSPATGQYSVSAGVYTFAAADTGANVQISYSYTTAATGNTIPVANLRSAPATLFEVVAFNAYGGKALGVKLYACTFDKLGFAFKAEDYLEHTLDFDALQNSSGQVGALYSKE